MILYFVFFAIGLYFISSDVVAMPLSSFLGAYCMIMAYQGTSLWAIKSGYYKRWSDAAFTFAQIFVVQMSVILAMSYMNYVQQAAMVMVTFLGLSFGVFSLSRLYFMALSCIPLAAFAYFIALHVINDTLGEGVTINIAILQWLAMLLLFIFCSTVANYLTVLRIRSKKNRKQLIIQKEDLEIAHRELVSMLRQTEEKASKDELTGLYNRRQFSEVWHTQVSVALASNAPLGFLIMDIDHFKPVNDTYGHLAGDEVLRAFNKIQEHCLRKTDFIARYGGEEFVVLLPDASEKTLLEIGERIRRFVEGLVFDDIEKGFHITVSIGATHYMDREIPENTIKRADNNLYQAKNSGRNQLIYTC